MYKSSEAKICQKFRRYAKINCIFLRPKFDKESVHMLFINPRDTLSMDLVTHEGSTISLHNKILEFCRSTELVVEISRGNTSHF